MDDLRIATGFGEALRGIAVDGEDRIVAVGDSMVKLFDPAGVLVREWATTLPAYSVTVDSDGQVWHLIILSTSGARDTYR